MPLIITPGNYNFQAKDTLLTSVFAVSSSVFVPLWKNGLKHITVYGSHFKEPKFIVANIILVKVATQHIRSLSVCCLQNGFRSSLQESKTSKPFPKLHKFFSLKPSARSSKLNYQRSRISGQFCNAIARDKKQLFYKSWPIRLTPRLSQGICAMKFQHVPTRLSRNVK